MLYFNKRLILIFSAIILFLFSFDLSLSEERSLNEVRKIVGQLIMANIWGLYEYSEAELKAITDYNVGFMIVRRENLRKKEEIKMPKIHGFGIKEIDSSFVAGTGGEDNPFNKYKITSLSKEEWLGVINKLRDLSIKHSKIPIMFAVDMEGGGQMILNNETSFPIPKNPEHKNPLDPPLDEYWSPGYLSKNKTPEDTFKYADIIGQALKELEISLNLAPVAGIPATFWGQDCADYQMLQTVRAENTFLQSYISHRSYGRNPELRTKHIEKFVEGLKKHNIIGTLKNFPGNYSEESTNWRYELPKYSLGQALKKYFETSGFPFFNKTFGEMLNNELVPFVETSPELRDIVMVQHSIVPQLNMHFGDDPRAPLIFSPNVLKFIKDELGYRALISDDLAIIEQFCGYKEERTCSPCALTKELLENIPEKCAEIECFMNEYLTKKRDPSDIQTIFYQLDYTGGDWFERCKDIYWARFKNLGDMAVAAVKSGMDILIISNFPWYICPPGQKLTRVVSDALVNAVISGELPYERVLDAYYRVLSIKRKAGLIKE